jgi:hypothetical protein
MDQLHTCTKELAFAGSIIMLDLVQTASEQINAAYFIQGNLSQDRLLCVGIPGFTSSLVGTKLHVIPGIVSSGSCQTQKG